MTRLKPVFDAGRLAVMLNIGPLMQPTTLAQYKAGNVPLPPKLFSHNDQSSLWQSSRPEGATSGWGGRVADLALRLGGGGISAETQATIATAVATITATTDAGKLNRVKASWLMVLAAPEYQVQK